MYPYFCTSSPVSLFSKVFFSIIFIVAFTFVPPLVSFPQDNCTITQKAFNANESLTFRVYYNWGFIWVKAGEVNFSVKDTTYNNNPAYHFKGTGFSYPHYDWFFKVRDTYQSLVDTTTLKPYRFIRDVHEGSYYVYYDYRFDTMKKRIISLSKTKPEQKLLRDTVPITPCTFDVMSMVYYSRCIDFSRYKANDTIPITLIISKQVHHLFIKYLGKDVLETDFGTFNCIKFNPLLVEGTVFSKGDGMVVWVTDDENKMPLYVETPIVIGSVNVKLIKYKGLKYDLTSKKK